jgi:hypothetical protein
LTISRAISYRPEVLATCVARELAWEWVRMKEAEAAGTTRPPPMAVLTLISETRLQRAECVERPPALVRHMHSGLARPGPFACRTELFCSAEAPRALSNSDISLLRVGC